MRVIRGRRQGWNRHQHKRDKAATAASCVANHRGVAGRIGAAASRCSVRHLWAGASAGWPGAPSQRSNPIPRSLTMCASCALSHRSCMLLRMCMLSCASSTRRLSARWTRAGRMRTQAQRQTTTRGEDDAADADCAARSGLTGRREWMHAARRGRHACMLGESDSECGSSGAQQTPCCCLLRTPLFV